MHDGIIAVPLDDCLIELTRETANMATTSKTADIGLIGLAVMGENLVLNMESHGFTVAVFNRTTSKVDAFVEGRAKGKKIVGTHSVEELVAALKTPRKIMIMVKAGAPVDDVINELVPLLEPGDILIDGGNSHFPDSTRRTQDLKAKGLLFIGTGVSGRRRRGARRARRSCPAAIPTRGRTSSRSSRRSPPRSPTAPLAATGSGPKGPATTSRWCTTASNTATCSSFAKPIT